MRQITEMEHPMYETICRARRSAGGMVCGNMNTRSIHTMYTQFENTVYLGKTAAYIHNVISSATRID